ncbi:MAG: hypothetical protein Q9174_005292 [Haloplaca sp. 1 TL-2023]
MPGRGLRQALLWLSCLIHAMLAAATGLHNASALCQSLSATFRNGTHLPSYGDYLRLSTENWSATAWAKPACIIQPRKTKDLQQVVRTLTSQNISFAIRSGGHMPSPGAANIDDGVLVDMSSFREVSYNATDNTARVGPGQTWGGVYAHLDEYNVTVVGGRVLEVGVGGLVLGCGLSYLSDLYGLACDNVVNFEVVLANGSLVHANEGSNPDLWWALKGGGNNFGIVTAFTLSTYPIHQVWGGVKVYTNNQLPELFSAMLQYQSAPDKDPYANVIFQAFTTNASVGAVLNMVYLKPEMSPAAFNPFYSIPTVNDTTKIQSLTEMISGQMVPPLPRFDWFATSFKPSASLYKEIEALVTAAPEVGTIASLTSGSLALALQPISTSVILASNARGGNALGLQEVNQTWFALDTAYWFSADDETAHNATRGLHAKIESKARKYGKHLPYQFMNDASYDQHVIEHYGTANVAKLKAVQGKYDPGLVFQSLVPGGFKIPK